MSTMTGNGMHVKPGLGKSLLMVALVTAAVLIIALVAMQFTNEVNWTGSDFVAAGILLALAGLAITFALRKLRTAKARLFAVGVVGLGFLYCWAEMAVGIFTDLGS
jgi:UDP-N-acetylmuramyl pentapeptide phosphotransferase/UDP-N-acetylglucosamine-1-phosphate transferase